MSTDARPSVLVHATEEVLEEYTFGRICEPQLGWLEEHLLNCPQCQSELEDIEEYKVFMKAGLASFESERLAAAGPVASPARSGSPVGLRSGVREALSLYFALPRIPGIEHLLAAGVLLVLAGAVVTWRMESPVASGRPLELVFGRTDLAADLSYRAEVVDASGRQMWNGNVRIADRSLSIRVDRPLRAGAYWVRLYTSTGQLLREFGLSVG